VPSCLALVGQALNRLTEDKGEFEGLEVKTAFKGLKTTTVYAWRDLEPYRKFLKSL